MVEIWRNSDPGGSRAGGSSLECHFKESKECFSETQISNFNPNYLCLGENCTEQMFIILEGLSNVKQKK